MLVICNGAYKSGSTWLFNITSALADFSFPPEIYRNPKWRNPSIDPSKLQQFIDSVDFQTKNYVCKQHINDRVNRRLILDTPHVVMLDIERDMRDVLVSAYHHHKRDRRFVGSFEEFYWTEGRLIAHQVRYYHAFWRVMQEKVFVASYEKLHSNFVIEVGRLAAFLRLPTSVSFLENIRQQTSIDALRLKYGEADKQVGQRFFRKGIVGDWQRYFTPLMLDDLRSIEAHGLARPNQLWCRMRTKLHRAVRAYPRRLFGAEGSSTEPPNQR
jgi:hypothetical protein